MTTKIAHITDPAITISINTTFPRVRNKTELYDYTRGIWRVDRERAARARFALAVYKGEVVEVFEIDGWHPARSTEYRSKRDFLGTDPEGRSEFVGRIAADKVRERYVGKRIDERSYGSPVRYWNC